MWEKNQYLINHTDHLFVTVPDDLNIDNNSSNTEGFLKQDDSVRLLELINSPPPLIPSNNNSDSGFRMSSFSVGSSGSLSESLTNPSRQIKRRKNEYVKVRPQSREVLENEQNLERVN